MQTRILKKVDVLTTFGYSASTLDRRIEMGVMVPPINLGGRRVGFLSDEVDRVFLAMVRGTAPEDLKRLVSELILLRHAVEVAADQSTNSRFNNRSRPNV